MARTEGDFCNPINPAYWSPERREAKAGEIRANNQIMLARAWESAGTSDRNVMMGPPD